MLAHSQNQGKDGGSLTESAVQEHPELLQTYLQVDCSKRATQFLHQWITEARASFSLEELRQSIQGYQLYVDDALPGIWDFTTDVVVLTDEDGQPLREAFRLRGQSKFIWMTNLPAPDIAGLADADTIFVTAGEQVEVEALEPILSRYSLPRVALIAMNSDADDEKHFHMVAKSIGTCVIGGATTQWLPQMTAGSG